MNEPRYQVYPIACGVMAATVLLLLFGIYRLGEQEARLDKIEAQMCLLGTLPCEVSK